MPVRALLCDRDGTLIVDVPYNSDPDLMEPMPGVVRELARARAHGLKVGVVTNQSGLAMGLFDHQQLSRMHERLEALVGPLDVIRACPHEAAASCACRKPRPGLVLAAAEDLGFAPSECAVVGDTWADVEAARRAGAFGILVPNARTRAEEVGAAHAVAWSFADAVERVLS
jgi:D-glycero-D-manno-heptose 1,7-bisphosphate phosphatase